MAILISDKIDFWFKKSLQRGILYNYKRANHSGRYYNPTCMHIQNQSLSIYEANMDGLKIEMSKSTIIVGDLKTSPLSS